jgi:hypothetical protein
MLVGGLKIKSTPHQTTKEKVHHPFQGFLMNIARTECIKSITMFPLSCTTESMRSLHLIATWDHSMAATRLHSRIAT